MLNWKIIFPQIFRRLLTFLTASSTDDFEWKYATADPLQQQQQQQEEKRKRTESKKKKKPYRINNCTINFQLW